MALSNSRRNRPFPSDSPSQIAPSLSFTTYLVRPCLSYTTDRPASVLPSATTPVEASLSTATCQLGSPRAVASRQAEPVQADPLLTHSTIRARSGLISATIRLNSDQPIATSPILPCPPIATTLTPSDQSIATIRADPRYVTSLLLARHAEPSRQPRPSPVVTHTTTLNVPRQFAATSRVTAFLIYSRPQDQPNPHSTLHRDLPLRTRPIATFHVTPCLLTATYRSIYEPNLRDLPCQARLDQLALFKPRHRDYPCLSTSSRLT